MNCVFFFFCFLLSRNVIVRKVGKKIEECGEIPMSQFFLQNDAWYSSVTDRLFLRPSNAMPRINNSRNKTEPFHIH